MTYTTVVEKIANRLHMLEIERRRSIIDSKSEILKMLKSAYKNYVNFYNRSEHTQAPMPIEEYAISNYWGFMLDPGTLVKVKLEDCQRYAVVVGPCTNWADVEVSIPGYGCKYYSIESISESDIPNDIIELVKKGGAK